MIDNSGTTYLVHLPDGNELGPASLDDLRAWVEAEVVGKTTALSLVGSEARFPAVTVPGLFGRGDAPTSSPALQPQQPLPPPPTLSSIAERTQSPGSAIQAATGRGATNFTRTTADAVVGWVGVVLSSLVFLVVILSVVFEANKSYEAPPPGMGLDYPGEPMSSGAFASMALMWLVNFVMVTAFIGLIRARPWSFSVGIVAGILGILTKVVGVAQATPGDFDGGWFVLEVVEWLVPTLFAVYCWLRLDSTRQVGRV